MDRRPLEILAELAAIPSTSFHEIRAARCAMHLLRGIGLSPVVDPYGNLIAHYARGSAVHAVALVAHLDHPGLEITAVESTSAARGVPLGTIRPAYFVRPVPIQLIGPVESFPAMIVGHEVDPETGRVRSLWIEHDGRAAVGNFGVFNLPGFVEDGAELALRAADDLVGVAAVIAALERLVESSQTVSVYGVLTRAEEVGLVGADAIASDRGLPADSIVISLECSPRRPGAEPGQGPVIRVGDRTQSFDPRAEAILLEARSGLPGLPIQRQLMDGGTCEATAFLHYGYRTTGVAVPLTNYHNMGPADDIVPERIHLADFLGEIALLVEACLVAGRGLTAGDDRQRRTKHHRDRLRATAAEFQAIENG